MTGRSPIRATTQPDIQALGRSPERRSHPCEKNTLPPWYQISRQDEAEIRLCSRNHSQGKARLRACNPCTGYVSSKCSKHKRLSFLWFSAAEEFLPVPRVRQIQALQAGQGQQVRHRKGGLSQKQEAVGWWEVTSASVQLIAFEFARGNGTVIAMGFGTVASQGGLVRLCS